MPRALFGGERTCGSKSTRSKSRHQLISGNSRRNSRGYHKVTKSITMSRTDGFIRRVYKQYAGAAGFKRRSHHHERITDSWTGTRWANQVAFALVSTFRRTSRIANIRASHRFRVRNEEEFSLPRLSLLISPGFFPRIGLFQIRYSELKGSSDPRLIINSLGVPSRISDGSYKRRIWFTFCKL